jgi:hypothetical protein
MDLLFGRAQRANLNETGIKQLYENVKNKRQLHYQERHKKNFVNKPRETNGKNKI